MKIKFIKCVLLLLLTTYNTSIAQNNEQDIKYSFVMDLYSNKVKIDSVVENYMLLKYIKEDKLSEAKKSISFSLESLRALMQNSCALDSIKIIRFDKIENDSIKLNTGSLDVKDVYIVFSDNHVLFPLVEKEGKIASFSTIRKGGDIQYLLLWY